MIDILSRLQSVFQDVFDESLVLKRETSSHDIESWDSLAQANIIVACESEFGIKFELNDIIKSKSVGDIVDIVERKLKQ